MKNAVWALSMVITTIATLLLIVMFWPIYEIIAADVNYSSAQSRLEYTQKNLKLKLTAVELSEANDKLNGKPISSATKQLRAEAEVANTEVTSANDNYIKCELASQEARVRFKDKWNSILSLFK